MAEKSKIIVSDLHIGAGRVAEGNVLDDFVKDQEFVAFLGGFRAESEAQNTDFELIIAGDMVEFLQVPAVDTFDPAAHYPPEAYYPATEAASVQKINLVIQGHPTVFTALRDWLRPAGPRRTLTILKGNHDVYLHWPGVQGRIRQAVDATGERAGLLVFEEQWISREGLYVEHGNQYAEKLNRFDDFAAPYDPKRPGELVTPPGSQFVIEFFNDVEREKWWVDSIKPITALIWYGFALDFAFAARVLVNFLRVSPILIAGSLAAEPAAIAAEVESLRQELSDEARVRDLARRYAADEAFRREFNGRVGRVLSAIEPPPATAAAVPEAITALAQAQGIEEQLATDLRGVAQAKVREEGAQVVVFGHTHRALCAPLDGGVYLNSGTWTWRRNFEGADLETWRDFYAHPEKYTEPHYLTYVRVDYDADGRPTGRVLDYSGQLVIECPPPAKERSWWARFIAWLKQLLVVSR